VKRSYSKYANVSPKSSSVVQTLIILLVVCGIITTNDTSYPIAKALFFINAFIKKTGLLSMTGIFSKDNLLVNRLYYTGK